MYSAPNIRCTKKKNKLYFKELIKLGGQIQFTRDITLKGFYFQLLFFFEISFGF